ncbi:hypothetical protein BO86DRAFT_413329 [Aspergillus japonicus CBS 114.51]|uniref:Uncharacterized protein n=1 Tax=Aspergillus japonicus CBS 114.51 TaxID=1448312 RepID=A0A8T8WN80_ASPJA|nr:hypothetical protein BO86DRAFT_413329 [Aspergillus japonicus CBS 114.51]RAH77144.1 hypothetical protein BO86DRAFT_413329 [Aspergillus japonicus CBS 114.51]
MPSLGFASFSSPEYVLIFGQCPASHSPKASVHDCTCCQAYHLHARSLYLSVRQPHNLGYNQNAGGGAAAVLFKSLIQADWSSFGILFSSTTRLPGASIFSSRAVAEKVFSAFILRLELLELLAVHQELVGAGISLGLDAVAARAVASQRLAVWLSGRDGHAEDEPQILDWAQEMDDLIAQAAAWQLLLDTVGGGLEVLLLDYDVHPSTVLHAGLELREACVGLSGVAEMLICLHGSRSCQRRWSLAREIQVRVRSSIRNCSVGGAGPDEDVRMEGAE